MPSGAIRESDRFEPARTPPRMIKAYDKVGSRDEVPCDLSAATLHDSVVWLDLLDPQPDEIHFVERFIKVSLPSDDSLTELQVSNRLRFDDDTVQVFTPVVHRDDEGDLRTTTVGFILGATLLVTIRTEKLRSFADYIAREARPDDHSVHSPVDVFVGLLESIIDRLSDGMEAVGADLDRVSKQIFGSQLDRPKTSKPVRYEEKLQGTLQLIGRSGDLTSNIRDSLLGIGRVLAFVTANVTDRIPPGAKSRIKIMRQDITALNDYETRLTDKVQFLLDSTLGFINIDQNRLFKLLTIASVIGIPPTFVVGLYGMNFKNMPEYDWAYGYQYGLVMIVLSIVIPFVWLRWRGWI